MIITGMDHFQSVCKKKLVVSIHPSAKGESMKLFL